MFHAPVRRFFSTFGRRGVDKLCGGLTFIGLACGYVAALSGCNSAPPTDPRRVFRYNQSEQSGALTSLDPAFARNQANIWAQTQLYNGLVELDSTLRPAPALARIWTVSPDARTYTFRLRPGVRFHDDACFGPGGHGLSLIHI